jgi:hypothetical protein
MKKYIGVLIPALLLVSLMLPVSSDAFVLTATDFQGYLAYDQSNDVFGTFDLDPRFSYENTEQYFNAAAFMAFTFTYDPVYPSIQDVINNPTTKWDWDLDVTGITNPWTGGGLPNINANAYMSYADLFDGVSWANQVLHNLFDFDGYYLFDYAFTSPTTGSATLSLAGNVDLGGWSRCLPEQWMGTFESDLTAKVTTQPVPEPVSLTLFGLGLAGIAVVRRRYR